MKSTFVFLGRHRRIILGICVSLWICAFVLTHIPAPELPNVNVGDKILHVVGYFGLASIFLMTLMAYVVSRTRRIMLVAVCMIIYAMFDETTQPMFNRAADIRDWVADIAGAILAIIVLELLVVAVLVLRHRNESTTCPRS